VFCGSRSGRNEAHAEAARTLGRELAERKIELVYGAGSTGLMGILADSTLEAGGRVTGVIPQSLATRELMHRGLTTTHVVADMHARKATMAQLSDAFIALPGGYGTLEELFEVTAWAQLGFHAKPVGLLNSGGFFDPLIAFLDHTVGQGFLRADHRRLVLVATGAIELLDSLTPSPESGPSST
jgi:uncharacterized protein (TIGR00730 family)